MKLALIRREYSATGGAEQYLQRLLAGLSAAGHEPHLFTEGWAEPPPGVQLHPVVGGGSRATRAGRFAQAVEAALAGQSFDCIFSLERTGRQDVYRAGDGVHRVWLRQRKLFAPWWRRPWVGWGAFHRNLLKLEAMTFDPARTGHVIVNSEMVRREIQKCFSFPAERIHLVRNGVDVARFQNPRLNRAAARRRFGVPEEAFLVLFVGSGWERKGLRFTLQAMAKLREIGEMTSILRGKVPPGSAYAKVTRAPHLLVVGKGNPPRETPPDVTYAGPVAEVEQAYAAADVLVFLPIYEPSANVVAEALAAGLPVVTSACNGASELITPGKNGAVVEDPRDAEAVLQGMLPYLTNVVRQIPPARHSLFMERNVRETIAVLEQAAREKKR